VVARASRRAEVAVPLHRSGAGRHVVGFTQERVHRNVGVEGLLGNHVLAGRAFGRMVATEQADADVAGVGSAGVGTEGKGRDLLKGCAAVAERATLEDVSAPVYDKLIPDVTPAASVLVKILDGLDLGASFFQRGGLEPGGVVERDIPKRWRTAEAQRGRGTDERCGVPLCPCDECWRDDVGGGGFAVLLAGVKR